MTELDLIIDLHKNSERQGPGSEHDTLRALELLNLPTDQILKVADIGCGSGGQTITLTKNLNAQITAVDLFPEFLNELNEKSQQLENNGYSLTGYFYLSQDSWMETFYKPMQARFETFLERNGHSELARKVVKDHQAEIELYLQFKDYFSYGFYIAQKNEA